MRFRVDEALNLNSYWSRDIGFIVKSVALPTVQPKAEEVNSYNHKRQVYTGVSYNPLTLAIHDTADAMALRMWSDYSSYYFSDFSQIPMQTAYDIVDFNTGPSGDWGLKISTSDDPNTTNFFSGVDIYQVFRGTYIKTTIVNPRIISFDPEELDYASMDHLSYRMTLTYENVNYYNGGAPSPLSDDAYLSSVFSDPRLEGGAGEPDDSDSVLTTALGALGGSSQGGLLTTALTDAFGLLGGSGGTAVSQTINSPLTAGLGGVLGTFGSLNFGSGQSTLNPNTLGQIQNLAGSALLGGGGSGISGSLYDAARGLVSGMGAAGGLGTALTQGILASAISAGNAVGNQVSNAGGAVLSSQAYANTNNFSGQMSQIGYIDTPIGSSPDIPIEQPDDSGVTNDISGDLNFGSSDSSGLITPFI